jgi:uncharacterized protein (UPF0548 family)
VFLLRKPGRDEISAFLERQGSFNYEGVGITASQAPPGYKVDRSCVLLGRGAKVFAAAKEALRKWQQFHVSWLNLCWQDSPLEPGKTVGILVRVMGVWSLDACRIVYVVDEAARFGFAYGTVGSHVVRGEERFLVTWDPKDDTVWYEILAISRPHQVITWLGYPYLRCKQKQFRRESATAMISAIQSDKF